jgi:hypothetical protein
MIFFSSVCILQTDDKGRYGHSERLQIVLREQEVQEKPRAGRKAPELLS